MRSGNLPTTNLGPSLVILLSGMICQNCSGRRPLFVADMCRALA